MGLGDLVGKGLGPVGHRFAPQLTTGFVREVLHRAVDGFGKLPGAAESADKRLADNKGDADQAVHDLIEAHVRLAGVQGFLTNIGGIATMAFTVPANLTGLAVLQCHLVAGIAHLRGYDLADPRVRNAVLSCLLGEDAQEELVKKGTLPSSPMGIATAPVHDPAVDDATAAAVTNELLGRIGGRRMVLTISRRVPVLGGGVGAISDAVSTYRVGRFADRELLMRQPPGAPPPGAPQPG
jgi:hypothetical protein